MTSIINQYQFVVNRLHYSIKSQQRLLELVNWASKYFYLQNSRNQIKGAVVKNGSTIDLLYLNPANGTITIDAKTIEQYVPNFDQYIVGMKARGAHVRLNTATHQYEINEQSSSNDLKSLKSLLLTVFIKVRFYSC